MARSARQMSRLILVAAVAAALTALSCGGGMQESVTGPTAIPEVEIAYDTGDTGGLTASCVKSQVCHYADGKYNLLQVSRWAAIAHLAHHRRDRKPYANGSCTTPPPVATCPCFSAEDLAGLQGQCPAGLTLAVSCPVQYSVQAFCSAGGGAPRGNLGYFEAKVGAGYCQTTSTDPVSGDTVTVQKPVTNAEYGACKTALVGSPVYPASCPR